ncbi:flagellar hook-length control protein FliK [Frigidibacter sp. MR17.24]|uniref:flagellar hook-length control protein FliK n=1 Tax=Frigidibacter sp. MR17.24 TaxID=3127345 RepID=UPI0030130F11
MAGLAIEIMQGLGALGAAGSKAVASRSAADIGVAGDTARRFDQLVKPKGESLPQGGEPAGDESAPTADEVLESAAESLEALAESGTDDPEALQDVLSALRDALKTARPGTAEDTATAAGHFAEALATLAPDGPDSAATADESGGDAEAADPAEALLDEIGALIAGLMPQDLPPALSPAALSLAGGTAADSAAAPDPATQALAPTGPAAASAAVAAQAPVIATAAPTVAATTDATSQGDAADTAEDTAAAPPKPFDALVAKLRDGTGRAADAPEAGRAAGETALSGAGQPGADLADAARTGTDPAGAAPAGASQATASQATASQAGAASAAGLAAASMTSRTEATAAPAAQAPADPTPAQQRLAQSVADQVRGVAIEDGSTRIELRPHGLGQIEIDIAQAPDGTLKVTMRAENPIVLDALRADRLVMTEMMQDRGFSMQGGGPDFEQFGGQQQDRDRRATSGRRTEIAEIGETEAEAGPTRMIAADGRLDLLT